MTKELLFKNLDECLANVDASFSVEDINFMVEVGYNEMKDWTYRNFEIFARDVAGEWGDYCYVLHEYDLLPDLIEKMSLVKDWFSDHEETMRDCLIYCNILGADSKLSGDTLYELFETVDTESIADWLTEDGNEQAYRDCVRYIVSQKGGN